MLSSCVRSIDGRALRRAVLTAAIMPALVGVVAQEASAQTRRKSDRRVPVAKTPTPAPAPAPEPMPAPQPMPMPEPPPPPPAPMPAPPVAMEPAPAPVTPLPEAQPVMNRRYGNGVYGGVAGGATFPVRDARDVYNTGWNGMAFLGWDSPRSPLGVRLDGQYDRLYGRDFRVAGSSTGSLVTPAVTGQFPDAEVWSGTLNGKLRLPFGRSGAGGTHGLYAIAGGGVSHLRNTRSEDRRDGEGVTKPHANAGLGISFAVGRTALTLESRYVRIFTEGRSFDRVPVTLGISLF